MATTLIVAALVLLAAGVGVRLFMEREAESRVKPGEAADLAALALGSRSNVFLLCPSEPPLCSAPADRLSPVFAIDWQELRRRLEAALAGEKRLTLVEESADGRRLVYIQRSALLRFPDVVTVVFLPLDPARSTLAVLSRSRYGRSDLGVNRARVERWLALLERLAPPEQPSAATGIP